MSRIINYDLFFKGKYIGTYTAKMIAKKLELNYEYVTLSARQGKTMKKNWKAVKSDKELTKKRQAVIDHQKIVRMQKRLKVTDSIRPERTSSAGRTYKLPVWRCM